MGRLSTTLRALVGVGLATAVTAPGAGAAVPVVVLEGRGFGHGVGMAQDGALAMGRAGASSAQILSQFYPGTRLGRAGGEVRVAVWSGGAEAVVAFPAGGEIRTSRGGSSAPGFPVRVAPGARPASASATAATAWFPPEPFDRRRPVRHRPRRPRRRPRPRRRRHRRPSLPY